MPAGFDKCVKDGGKVWTKSNGNTYRHFCTLNGQTHAGELKQKKTAHEKSVSKK